MQVFWAVRRDSCSERSISGLGLVSFFVFGVALAKQVKSSREKRRERKALCAGWIPSPPANGGLG